jgi:hypothetical protein
MIDVDEVHADRAMRDTGFALARARDLDFAVLEDFRSAERFETDGSGHDI